MSDSWSLSVNLVDDFSVPNFELNILRGYDVKEIKYSTIPYESINKLLVDTVGYATILELSIIQKF